MRCVDRVADQVHDDLVHLRRVTRHRRQHAQVRLELNLLLLGVTGDDVQCAGDAGVDVDRLQVAFVKPDEVGGAVEIDHLTEALRVALQHRDVVAHERQRVVDLVRHAGHHLPQAHHFLRLHEVSLSLA